MDKSTEQVDFWRGDFGTDYVSRNAVSGDVMRARINTWAKVLDCLAGRPPQSFLEVGANIGLNLRALKALSGAELHAVEPNAAARSRLAEDGVLEPRHIHDGTAAALPFADNSVDLVFTCGVMIHIHPRDLPASCQEIYRVARRYIVCMEYFSDKTEELEYRGNKEKLFKRDFGSFWLDHFENLKLVDYGFFWRRATGLDNPTWWVFEKPDSKS